MLYVPYANHGIMDGCHKMALIHSVEASRKTISLSHISDEVYYKIFDQ